MDVDAGLALNGKYVWRGQVVTPDPVLQPDVTVNFLGFSAGFWGNIDTNDVNGMEWEFNEVDWTLGYEMNLPLLNLGAGFINYTFPGSDASGTTEFYLGASVNVLLSPSLTVYQDIEQFPVHISEYAGKGQDRTQTYYQKYQQAVTGKFLINHFKRNDRGINTQYRDYNIQARSKTNILFPF